MWYPLSIIMIILGAHLVYKEHDKTKHIKTETALCKLLKRCAKKFQGVMLENCTITDTHDSKSVDAVLLTQKALYVFSIKNHEGVIYGSPDEIYWTAEFKRKKQKRLLTNQSQSLAKLKFNNPLLQSENHVNIIMSKLEGIEALPIINIVVFPKTANLQAFKDNPTITDIKRVVSLIESEESKYPRTMTLIEQLTLIKFLNIDIRDIKPNNILNKKTQDFSVS